MIIFKLILIRTGHQPEIITAELQTIPSLHEYVSIGGQIYRVEDITHNIETKDIEVRAIT